MSATEDIRLKFEVLSEAVSVKSDESRSHFVFNHEMYSQSCDSVIGVIE